MTHSLQGLYHFMNNYSRIIKNGRQIIDMEFDRINYQSIEDKNTQKSTEGEKDANRKKNRYKDILPYDYTRVTIPKKGFITDGSDYINANKILDEASKAYYIASQAPMPNTVKEFWKMIWHYDVKLLIMVCKEVEKGKERCHRYWPYRDEEVQFKSIKISLEDDRDYAKGLKMRKLKVLKGSKERTVTQLQYTEWPDHGAPETSETILQLITIAREMHPGDDPPILVHCSAGCGRTGAIIAIDCARKLIQTRASNISVFDIVTGLRKQRPAMVQTTEQYDFVYRVVHELVVAELKKVDTLQGMNSFGNA